MAALDTHTTPTRTSKLPPASRGWPIIGDAARILSNPIAYFNRQIEAYGRVHTAYLGPQKIVFLHDADAVRHILWENQQNYPKPDLGMATLEPLLGNGIATLTDHAKWAEARKFVLPLFSRKMLDLYFEQIVDSVSEEIDHLMPVANDQGEIDMYTLMHEATFRVLIRTIFARGISKSEIPQLTEWFNNQTAYINARYLTMNSPLAMAFPAAWKGKADLAKLDARVDRLIDDREKENVTEISDMLDSLILARHDDGSPLGRKEIRDNCMTLLFGGHETTAGSVTWTWGMLSKNPDVRDKLLTEVDRVIGDRRPTLEDYRKLEYTDMVFRETMRLYPMFSMLLRTASKDDEICGYKVSAGDLIAFSAYTIARDPNFWPEPERFDPERFSKDNDAKRPKGTYLPFSLGARGCIGEKMARMEGVLLIAMMSRSFLFDLEGGNLPEPKVSMSIKPKGGMPMTVRAR